MADSDARSKWSVSSASVKCPFPVRGYVGHSNSMNLTGQLRQLPGPDGVSIVNRAGHKEDLPPPAALYVCSATVPCLVTTIQCRATVSGLPGGAACAITRGSALSGHSVPAPWSAEVHPLGVSVRHDS